jgi:hypothetical protein
MLRNSIIGLVAMFVSITIYGQKVEKVIEIRDASGHDRPMTYGKAVRDSEGSLYYFQNQEAFVRNSQNEVVLNEGGIYVGGTYEERGAIIDTLDRYSYYTYALKISKDLAFENAYVFKNVREVLDVAVTEKEIYVLLDSWNNTPLMVGDSVYPSSKDKRERWLVVLDKQMQPKEVIHFHQTHIDCIQPSTEENEVYLGIWIHPWNDFIQLGEDTIWNYWLRSDTLFTPRPATAVLSKFNYKTREYKWHHKFGSISGSRIRDIELDKNGNVIVAGLAAGIEHIYLDNWVDSFPSTGFDMDGEVVAETVILKFSPDGAFNWGLTTPEGRWDIIYDLEVDSEDNIYWSASFQGDTLFIRDTFFLLTLPEFQNLSSNYVTIKVDSTGQFKWGHNLEGKFRYGYPINLTIGENDEIYSLSSIIGGEMTFNDTIIELDSAESLEYLYSLNPDGTEDKLMYISRDYETDIRQVIPLEDNKFIFQVDVSRNGKFFDYEFSDEPAEPIAFALVDFNGTVNTVDQISHQSDLKIETYPNPVEQGTPLHIRLSKTKECVITLISMDGRKLRTRHYPNNIINNEVLFNLPAGVPEGVYFLQVECDGEKIVNLIKLYQ